jgi:hypothetical protein
VSTARLYGVCGGAASRLPRGRSARGAGFGVDYRGGNHSGMDFRFSRFGNAL